MNPTLPIQQMAKGFEMPEPIVGAPTESDKTSFSKMLEKSMGDVNELLKTADKKATDMAVGKVENLHDAMIAIEKAETALKFVMQVRNKAIEAYHEIVRMQV